MSTHKPAQEQVTVQTPAAEVKVSGDAPLSVDVKTHEVKRTLMEFCAYPEHGPRTGDPHYKIFNHARHHLIDVLDAPCWIGGATKSQLQKGLPPGHPCHGANQNEAHHNMGEWAGLPEMDWQKVAKDFPQAGIDSDEKFLQVAESEGGLLILCDKHHRGGRHGIHAISEPVWKLQRYEREGYDFVPDDGTTVTIEAGTGEA